MENTTEETEGARRRLEAAYASERPRILARLKAAGRSLEEAEDIVHEIFAQIMGRIGLLARIVNLPALINSLVTRRLIDAWRHDRVRAAAGETEVAEEAIGEIISGIGLDPLDEAVRADLVEALNSALCALPPAQRKVMEAQVFEGKTFSQLAESTGESIDTLKARKRYAVANLSRALRRWIDE